MNKNEKHLTELNEIRSLMERSSRFISLSGLSGVFAGLIALAGSVASFFYLQAHGYPVRFNEYDLRIEKTVSIEVLHFLIFVAMSVLASALLAGIFFTYRKAKKNGLSVWDKVAERMLINLAIPLFAGGVFCIALYYYGVLFLIIPAMLIFYGLSLINASKYTLNDIRYLGALEIFIGIIALFLPGYGLYLWAIGFGVVHILYGAFMYIKYEK